MTLSPNSSFPEIFDSSAVELETLAFSRLEPGDFVVVDRGGQGEVRRFVGLHVERGVTQLRLCDHQHREELVAFPRLLGRVTKVCSSRDSADPNPPNFLQRFAFQVRHRLMATESVLLPAIPR